MEEEEEGWDLELYGMFYDDFYRQGKIHSPLSSNAVVMKLIVS